MKYSAVIFDLDGTLLNTLEDLTDSVNAALTKCGFPIRTIPEVRSFVGNGIRKLVWRAVPDNTSDEQTETVFKEFCVYYEAHCNDKTRPYEGIMEMLEELFRQGYRMAIVSNKADFAVKELNELYFADYIKVAIGEKESEGIRKKPAPDTVFMALQELGIAGENAVYVGDSDVDLETAENAGMPCICAEWGFRGKTFLMEHGGKMFAQEPMDILRILEE